MATEEQSGGPVLNAADVTFAPMMFTEITGGTLYDAVLGGWRQDFVVNDANEMVFVHTCQRPESSLDGPDEWQCPECQEVWDLHVETWWEPRED